MIPIRFALVIWCLIYASVATAHEFWIEPRAFQVAPEAQIAADLKNGENFKGTSLSYFDRNIARFDVITEGGTMPVEGRMGDMPALDMIAEEPGLVRIVHETTPSFVTYRTWEKFAAFAEHKDFKDIEARHQANGFADVPFKERYTRHAKGLVAVGDGIGQDREVGLKTEFVALTNPYAPDFDGTMRVELLFEGQPRVDAQVEVFDRNREGGVTVLLYRTDAQGIAAIPVTPGHDYLFDGVMLQTADDSDEAVWDTFWAALTFSVPAR